jgi:RNA polymerase sigma-70 factor (ECF subfamily)
MLHNLPDEALLNAFASGKDAAFNVLAERHGSAIKGYALRMLQSPQQAEEVYVETFLRVARSRGNWEPRGSVRGWLFTMAHRLCLDILRQRRVNREAFPQLVELAEARPPSPSPDAQALLNEQAAQLERLLARLPAEHRQVLLIRVVHGLSTGETAEATGLTEDQVASQLSYNATAARRREEA